MAIITPQSYKIRSAIYRHHNKANFIEVHDSAIAGSTANNMVFKHDDDSPALIDLTTLPRAGVRGPNAKAWLVQSGFIVPDKINTALLQDSNIQLLRVGISDFWLLPEPGNCRQPMPEIKPNIEGVYTTYFEDSRAWIVLSGECRANILAKLCALDLRANAFKQGDIVQTSIARVNSAVLNHNIGETSVFSIFVDSSLAHYLWTVLLDAMQEYNGKAVGER